MHENVRQGPDSSGFAGDLLGRMGDLLMALAAAMKGRLPGPQAFAAATVSASVQTPKAVDDRSLWFIDRTSEGANSWTSGSAGPTLKTLMKQPRSAADTVGVIQTASV